MARGSNMQNSGLLGAEELIAAMRSLPDALARDVERKALRAAAAPIAKQLRANLAETEDTGILRRSIVVRLVTTRKGRVRAMIGSRRKRVPHPYKTGRNGGALMVMPTRYFHLVEKGAPALGIGANRPFARAIDSQRGAAFEAFKGRARAEFSRVVAELRGQTAARKGTRNRLARSRIL
jgi:Bacteriophage protein of unknown function (DUF646).